MKAKKILLNDFHLNHNAKMIDFAGFFMPVQYKDIKTEHNAVRSNAGLFDISHMGELLITGPETEKLLSYITTYNAEKLKNNQAAYTLFINENGGIIDDLIIYKINPNVYYLIVNAANITKDYNWIYNNRRGYDCDLSDLSDNYSLFSLQGPASQKLISEYLKKEVDIKRFYFELDPANNITMIARTGYTGENGYELLVKNQFAEEVITKLYSLGNNKYNLELCGLGARDTLRLEAGLMLYGQDIDDNTTPAEANLMWVIKSDSFIGASKIKRKSKEIIFFKMNDRGIPRNNYKIKSIADDEIGYVTSGTYSYKYNQGIGIGYIKPGYKEKTKEIIISIHNKNKKAEIVNKLF